MNVPQLEPLPVILVSAKDKETAYDLISEIVNDVIEIKPQQPEIRWTLENKYYAADVQFYPLADGEHLEPMLCDLVEAHIIHLSDEEASGENALNLMAKRDTKRVDADIRLLAVGEPARVRPAEGAAASGPRRARAEPPAALVLAASRALIELVSLGAPPEPEEPGEEGAGRALAALHAHEWTGLRLHPDRADTDPAAEWEDEAGWEDVLEAEGEDGEEWRWARLGGAMARAGRGGRREPRLVRLARAERLLHALCRALENGDDLEESLQL